MSNIITDVSLGKGSDFCQANDMMNMLADYFPGWRWAVLVENGVLYIKNLTLHSTYGCQGAVHKLSKRKVLMMAGELLDRFGVSTKMKPADVEALPKEFDGNFKCDHFTKDERYRRKTYNERRLHGDYRL